MDIEIEMQEQSDQVVAKVVDESSHSIVTNLTANTLVVDLSGDATTSSNTLGKNVTSRSNFFNPKKRSNNKEPPDDQATLNERISSFMTPPNFRKLALNKKKSFISEYGIRLEETELQVVTKIVDNEETTTVSAEVVNEWFFCLCTNACLQKINCKKNTSSASDHLRSFHGVEGERGLNIKRKVAIVDGNIQNNIFTLKHELITIC